MRRKIAVGIDIGTYKIKVMVCESVRENDRFLPRIIGTGSAESRGLRHGYIVNFAETARSIADALHEAQKNAGIRIKRAFLSVGGVGLNALTSQGTVIVSRADSEVTELDLSSVIEVSDREIPQSQIINRKVIHTVPIQYKIDGKVLYGNPLGMKGMKIEAKVLFVTVIEQHLENLIQAVEEAGVEVVDVAAAPLAASLVTLTKTQKVAGCVLVNIGAETVSAVVFENSIPISLEVFPLGSTDITNDIALGFRIPLEDAEQIKLGTLGGTEFPRRKIEEIISTRLNDIFALVEVHLKKVGRSGLLPAGIVITGGGSGVPPIEELAKSSLRLPARIAGLHVSGVKEGVSGKIKDTSWSVAYGLCILGLTAPDENALGVRLEKTKSKIVEWLKQFLP